MSHHFDTPTAREDPRINVCDLYLFSGRPGTTAVAMTVNPDAGLSAPDTFRDEGLYAIRFDINGDLQEEVTFKFRFGEVHHAPNDEHTHIQRFRALRATGNDAVIGAAGDLLIEGETGRVHSHSGIRAYAGLAPDLFAGDASALHAFLAAYYKEHRYDPDAFKNRQDFFSNRNVSAIVLELPTDLIGHGLVHSWATASLHGHAPEVQVSRWGLPLITHLFLNDPEKQELREVFNRTTPVEDSALFSEPIGGFVEKMARYAGSAMDPVQYSKQVVERLSPTMLPYTLGTHAAFDRIGFNGRALTDDAMDVMLTLATNKPLSDGVAPDRHRTRTEFPYFGEPYSHSEQAHVTPVPRPPKK
jgi:hypothetical protein